MSTTHDHKATATALMGGGLSLTYGVRLKKLAAGAFLAGTLCLAVIGLGAGTANANPYWYDADFAMSTDIPTTYGFALDSFGRQGLDLLQPLGGGDTTVAGSPDGSVVVEVTFIQGFQPGIHGLHLGGSKVVVSAFSDDQNRAETMRNNVQSDIQHHP